VLAACRAARAQGTAPAGIVVTNCAAGPTGWIELLNRGADGVDLAKDGESCWFVDDALGAAAPSSSPTQRQPRRGRDLVRRSPSCAELRRHRGGEAVWVRYPFVNSTTPDACRLLTTPRVGGICTAP